MNFIVEIQKNTPIANSQSYSNKERMQPSAFAVINILISIYIFQFISSEYKIAFNQIKFWYCYFWSLYWKFETFERKKFEEPQIRIGPGTLSLGLWQGEHSLSSSQQIYQLRENDTFVYCYY